MDLFAAVSKLRSWRLFYTRRFYLQQLSWSGWFLQLAPMGQFSRSSPYSELMYFRVPLCWKYHGFCMNIGLQFLPLHSCIMIFSLWLFSVVNKNCVIDDSVGQASTTWDTTQRVLKTRSAGDCQNWQYHQSYISQVQERLVGANRGWLSLTVYRQPKLKAV